MVYTISIAKWIIGSIHTLQKQEFERGFDACVLLLSSSSLSSTSLTSDTWPIENNMESEDERIFLDVLCVYNTV